MALILRLLYHLPLRQTEGFVASILALMGLAVLARSHALSRRQAGLTVDWPLQPKDQPLHLVVDATGLKVYGEGEWKVRQHGWNKRRTWRKLHLGVDEATGEIVAQTLTTNSQDDAGQVEPLLDQIEAPIAAVGGDGAYDRRKVFEALAASDRGPPMRPIIPPQANAKIEQHPATAKPSRCPAMRRSEPSVNGGVERGKKPRLSSPLHRPETQISRLQTRYYDTLHARIPNPPTDRNTGGKMCHTGSLEPARCIWLNPKSSPN